MEGEEEKKNVLLFLFRFTDRHYDNIFKILYHSLLLGKHEHTLRHI